MSRTKFGLYRKFLASTTGLSEAEINKSIEALKQKGLIIVEEAFGYKKVRIKR